MTPLTVTTQTTTAGHLSMAAKRKRIRIHKGGRPKAEPRQKDPWEAVRKMRQVALVGDAPPELAEYPLGVLLARGIIDRDMHRAGCDYTVLYAKFTGRYKAVGVEPEGSAEVITDERQAEIEAKYRRARSALMKAGRRAADATDNVCCYNRLPRWLGVASYNPGRRAADERDRAALIEGLTALAVEIVGKRAVARAAE